MLEDNDDIAVREAKQDVRLSREILRRPELEAFRACRFQKGYASEGMLCDEPPIPLRVLDFLEARDLVRLSLVCKSTHQAAHLLFKREVWPNPRVLQDLILNRNSWLGSVGLGMMNVSGKCDWKVHCDVEAWHLGIHLGFCWLRGYPLLVKRSFAMT